MTNAEVITKWVNALRSGDYRQTDGTLRRDNGDGTSFCCLGVLCDLAVKEGVIDPPAHIQVGDGGDYYLYEGEADIPPSEVCDWAGLYDSDPDVEYMEYSESDGVCHYEDRDSLTSLNDARGKTFDEIADILEYNYLNPKGVYSSLTTANDKDSANG